VIEFSGINATVMFERTKYETEQNRKLLDCVEKLPDDFTIGHYVEHFKNIDPKLIKLLILAFFAQRYGQKYPFGFENVYEMEE
jgi:hypothetical protein